MLQSSQSNFKYKYKNKYKPKYSINNERHIRKLQMLRNEEGMKNSSQLDQKQQPPDLQPTLSS